MEPQQVVSVQTEATDWRLIFYSAVGPMPIVHVRPDGQIIGSLVGCPVGSRISPFAQRGLDEAFSLAVGFGRVRFCSDMVDLQISARLAKSLEM